MTEPTDEEFRAVGMTGDARRFPRSQRQIAMFAAFLNVRVEQLPLTFHYFANAHMRDAWSRVEAAAREDVA